MAIKTFGDLKKHLHGLDLVPLSKRLSSWLDDRARKMPPEVVALNLEWDLVGGETNDEVVGELLGYHAPGLDVNSPEAWDWSSGEHDQFLFLGLGAIWSEAVEILTGDEVPDVEDAIRSTLDTIVLAGLRGSQELHHRLSDGRLRMFWARRQESLREFDLAARNAS